jgi:hypothetical protein
MDAEQLRAAAYTREEAQAQLESVLQRYPPRAPPCCAGSTPSSPASTTRSGRCARRRSACRSARSPAASSRSAPASAPTARSSTPRSRTPPTDFERSDVVYIASLVGGIFGKGGGTEATNARWLQQLQRTFGDTDARGVYEDLRFRNDPEAPATASVPFPYEGATVDPTRPGAALPDLDAPRRPAPGRPPRLAAARAAAAAARRRRLRPGAPASSTARSARSTSGSAGPPGR